MEYMFEGFEFDLSEGDIIVTENESGNTDFVVVIIEHEDLRKYSLMRLDNMHIISDKCMSEDIYDLVEYVEKRYGVKIIVPYNYVNISY